MFGVKRYLILVGFVAILGFGSFLSQGHKSFTTPIPSQTPTPTGLPAVCKDQADLEKDAPIIFFLSQQSGTSGAELEISGCNFNGFEGDLNARIENLQGAKGLLRGQPGSTPRLLKVKLENKLCQMDTSYSGLPCTEWLELIPGNYKIYVEILKKSNEMPFEIKP